MDLYIVFVEVFVMWKFVDLVGRLGCVFMEVLVSDFFGYLMLKLIVEDDRIFVFVDVI